MSSKYARRFTAAMVRPSFAETVPRRTEM